MTPVISTIIISSSFPSLCGFFSPPFGRDRVGFRV